MALLTTRHTDQGLDGGGRCSLCSVQCQLGQAVVWRVPDLGLP